MKKLSLWALTISFCGLLVAGCATMNAGPESSDPTAGAGVKPAKEPVIDFKEPAKILNWIINRTEKRARRKAVGPKPEAAAKSASTGKPTDE